MCKRTKKIKERFYSLGHTRCHYCCVQLNYAPGFKNSATVEHIIPRSQGGTFAIKNCLVVCSTCNKKRANKSFTGFVSGSRFPRQGWLKLKYAEAQNFYGRPRAL